MIPTAPDVPPTTASIVYVGTYTKDSSKGIYAFRLDVQSATMKPLGLAGEAGNPSFLAIDAENLRLYAANEIGDYQGKKSGGVSGFSIDPKTAKLTRINDQPSGGSGPCHVSLDTTARTLLVANYGSGSVASLRIDPAGKLEGPVSSIQHTGSSVN